MWYYNKGKAKIETRIDHKIDYYLIGFISKFSQSLKVHIQQIQFIHTQSMARNSVELDLKPPKKVSVVDSIKNQFILQMAQNDKKELIKKLLQKQIPFPEVKVPKIPCPEVS